MIIRLVMFFVLASSVPVFANDLVAALLEKYPRGGFTKSGNDVSFHSDFPYPVPSKADVDLLVAAYLARDRVEARRLTEIKNQSMALYNQYALYSSLQSVIDYGAALRAVPATAQTEMAALPDVVSVKNYQPTWPAKPNL